MNARSIFAIGIVIVSALFVVYQINLSLEEHRAEITEQLRESLDRQANISQLIHQLGYSGFIHHYKDYVLSGDEQDYTAALEHLQQLEMLLNTGKNALSQDSTARQLKSIQKTLREYQLKLELVRQLHNQNLPVREIGLSARINDAAAAEALRELIMQFQIRSAVLLREDAKRQQHRDYLFTFFLILSVVFSALVFGVSWWNVAKWRARLREQADISSRQRLLDAAPNPTLVVAESGEILVANQGAAKLFECEREFLVGQQVEAFVPEADRVDHVEYRKLFFNSAGERTMRNPVVIETAKRTSKKVEILIGLYQLEKQRYAVVNLLDISNMENIERHASQMEQNFKMTFELAPVGMAEISLEGRFIKVNRQLANILGYERLTLEELSLDDLTPVAELKSNRLTFKRLLSNEVEHLRFEKRLLDSKARDVWVTLTMTVYRDEKFRPEYMIAIIEDISHRKQYEEELLASEAKFKSIANHVNAVVWMSSPGLDRIMFVSNRYEDVWGRSIASLIHDPTSFLDAIYPEDRPRLEAALEGHRKGVWNEDYRIINKDGHVRYIHDEGVPVRSAKGKLLFMVGLARDVTSERVAQEQLKRSNRQLEQLAKFDPLTMAVRRPYALSDLDECIALYMRYKTAASVIFIDLNDFKEVNDTHGHEAGDQVLIEFAKCMRKNIRQTDGFYRYAGDEFLLLLRETDVLECGSFLQKLQSLMVTSEVEGHRVQISLSFGAVTLGEQHIIDANHWIKVADDRMYDYKKAHKERRTLPGQG